VAEGILLPILERDKRLEVLDNCLMNQLSQAGIGITGGRIVGVHHSGTPSYYPAWYVPALTGWINAEQLPSDHKP
jgi:hypothetical protein